MDKLKVTTVKKYTAWDLNCRKYYNPKWEHNLRKKINRGARHSFKEILKKELDNLDKL